MPMVACSDEFPRWGGEAKLYAPALYSSTEAHQGLVQGVMVGCS